MSLELKQTAKRFRGWSLYRLANEMDVCTKTIYRWDKGSVMPSLPTLLRICEALDCTPNDLLGFETAESLEREGIRDE